MSVKDLMFVHYVLCLCAVCGFGFYIRTLFVCCDCVGLLVEIANVYIARRLLILALVDQCLT